MQNQPWCFYPNMGETVLECNDEQIREDCGKFACMHVRIT